MIVAAGLAGWGALSAAAPPPERAAPPPERASKATGPVEEYGGLPEAPGRAAVYFSCTACHSLKRFAQLRLSYEEWDKLLARMVKKNKMASMAPWARRLVLTYLASHLGDDEQDWRGLPPGPGREQVFYSCQACHSLAIVKQQGLSRESWDESLIWMVKKQAMPRLDPDDRKLILDYLATHYGLDSSRRRRKIR